MEELKENHMQVFVKGLDGKTTTIAIHKDAMVDDLKRKLHEMNGITVGEMRLIYTTHQLEDGKSLHDYNMEHGSTVFLVLRLRGGLWSGEIKELDEDVELSEAPDMITWDDDPENKRAKMPCGHAITPVSLTAYCHSLLDSGKCRFLCPYISRDNPPVYCGKEWDYVTVRRLAVLTNPEKKEFENKISTNFLMRSAGIQECPRCKSLVERSKKHIRVVCPLCTKRQGGSNFEFCWHCLREWKSSDTKNCGNDECSGEDPRLKMLRDCAKKTIVGVPDCPSRRACINCGLLIEHVAACKHMTCRCKAKFCFICLSPKGKNGYTCGRYNEVCKVAPVQTQIVGD